MNRYICLIVFYTLVNSNTVMAANTALGKQIYKQNCSICHGIQGISSMPSAPDFKRGNRLMQSDFSIVEHLKNGKNACPAFIGILKKQQMFNVIAYLRTFYP